VLSDTAELFRIRGDEIAMEFWDWPADRTIEETRGAAMSMLADSETGSEKFWTARKYADGEFVGVFDLSEIAGATADLGFMICRDHWGAGYAFEGTSAVLREACARGIANLRARIHVGNARSQRLLERLGFVAERECEIEVRPGTIKLCRFFSLRGTPHSGSV